MSHPPLTGISSMATRQLLADLSRDLTAACGLETRIESVGGVDAAKRVQADETFDLVFLAVDAIDKLEAAGKVVPGTRTDLVHSGTSVAVRAGAPRPDIGSEDAVRAAVLAARTVSYSTGPSGVALARLFERWGIAEQIRDRIVVPPPGTPVGALVARGDVELGFQQLSELIHVDGLDIVGPLPESIAVTTTFSGAVCASSTRPDDARRALAFMASPGTTDAKRRQGMTPA